MPSSHWHSPAAYTYAERITSASFAWEYLRRDKDYHRDFHRVRALPRNEVKAQAAFSERWGLRFRGRPEAVGAGFQRLLAA